MLTSADEAFMRHAMELAARGQYAAAPNPLVGCVIVSEDGTVIGEGWHRAHGAGHAEAEAYASVSKADRDLLARSTWYVTLEPCNHVGKTPACAGLIEQVAPKRVVIGLMDPNPRVKGGGMLRLQQAGIEVESGCLEDALRFQNRRFLWNMEQSRPWVVLKWAESADGFMDGRSEADRVPGSGGFAITGAEAQRLTHHWRALETGIAVGAQTALIDEPKLTVRLVDAASPAVVLLDPSGLITEALPTMQDREAVIHVSADPGQSIGSVHCAWDIGEDLDKLLASLYADHELSSILVEGGATVLNAFLHADCWNEIKRWTAPRDLHSGLKAPVLPASCGRMPQGEASRGTEGPDTWEHFLHPRHVFE